MKNNYITYIVVGVVALFVIITVIINILKRKKNNYYKTVLDKLEINKNLVASIPVSLELSKVESLNKNGELNDKCDEFKGRLDQIKNTFIPKIDDMLIELDTFYDKKDFVSCDSRISKTELEIYIVREYANTLLNEIKEITSSDEKYRSIITKLKNKYRKINREYQKHKNQYDEMQDAISLQLENIEKRFLDFEKSMDNNNYNEVVHITKALTTMIDHMTVVISEMPDVVLMCKQLLPKKIKEVDDTYKSMVNDGYILDYLNIDYNIKESKKNIENILDRIRVLNLEDCMFEVKTIMDYLDSLFVDFEKERISRKVFEEMNSDFSKKLDNTNKLVKYITDELEKIKSMYDLKMEDVTIIGEQNKALVVINDDYKKMKLKLENKATSYSELHKEIEDLTVRLKGMKEGLDVSLKSLGTMYEDEQRAREQLNEIERFLKISKNRIRSYKLPVVSDKYFVELNEANEAIREVIKELSNKPIVINTLNTRVDTARDLVLKLYDTTNEMIKTAYFTEQLNIYANRFRSDLKVAKLLDESNKMFFSGKYTDSLNRSLNAIRLVDISIYDKIVDLYKNNN